MNKIPSIEALREARPSEKGSRELKELLNSKEFYFSIFTSKLTTI